MVMVAKGYPVEEGVDFAPASGYTRVAMTFPRMIRIRPSLAARWNPNFIVRVH